MPKDPPRRAKRKETDGQAILTSKLSTMEMQKSKGQKNTTQTKSPKRRKTETNNNRRIKGNIESEIMQKEKKRKEVKGKRHAPPMAERQKQSAR